MEISIAPPFTPLFDQEDPNYYKRYLVWYGGRGSGKTVSIAKGLLIRGMIKTERILCAREFQNSISDSVLKTLEDEIDVMGLASFYKVQNNGIFGKNGTEFIFKGLRNNIQSIKSMAGVTIVWLEEAQTLSDRSYEVLIPTIRAEGSQIIISFNPDEEDDPTYVRFVTNPPPDAYVCLVNYDANPFFPETLRKEMEYSKRDTELYNHIWLGKTRKAGLGAVYGREMQEAEERITQVPWTPSAETNTYWDLGWADQTAIWFGQEAGLQPRAIDYYESNMQGLDHYVKIIKEKGYRYGKHILPHDAGHTRLGGKPIAQQLEDMGLGKVGQDIIILPIGPIASGIELGRQLIPQMWFDAEKCKQGIHCLRKYHYKFDPDRNLFSKEPLHDWSSNGADAFRYMATYLATRKTSRKYSHEPGSSSRGGF